MTMTATRYLHGTPNWATLKTNDISGSKSFYQTLFEWDFTARNKSNSTTSTISDGFEKLVAKRKGNQIASVAKQNKSLFGLTVPSTWDAFVTVTDLDKTLKLVDSAGGTLLEPAATVGTLGRAATIADPNNAVLRLWEAQDHDGSDIDGKLDVGSLAWLELEASDLDIAKKFYAEIFGWDSYEYWLPSDPYEPQCCYTVFTNGVTDVAGAVTPAINSLPSSWCVSFTVVDADVTAALAVRNGGYVITAPYDLPIGRQAVLADPDGAVFSVLAKG